MFKLWMWELVGEEEEVKKDNSKVDDDVDREKVRTSNR